MTSPKTRPSCTPYRSEFRTSSSISQEYFVPVDTPPRSYGFQSPGILALRLDRPNGRIKTSKGINDKVADGATLNSTMYGNYTFEVLGPRISGIVTAIVIIAPEGDEIDIELLGGDPHCWQSNVFVPHPSDKEPLYGVFAGRHCYKPSSRSHSASTDTVDSYHLYTVDWNPEKIIWGVDGIHVRTLRREDTIKNGVYHFPSNPARIQLGIWDASFPSGTSAWARGPVNWRTAPASMSAFARSVRIEC
ncbi:concanavalin A-like lectin/glucanase domain-containing protein [Cantharellus anzutake]|uniref:concanavalin A-like lectin/glucanase domain-containing protein n=1 Tax=Cantharellus anzutake TaxID=1750568 RepID=UPI00190483A9|nr:concanavalin A-like lectin/glucanase domain-containing protein [Cantharellus anzutake]KAF8328349.1 concanavalin A-like lectin/glucanase domain-containing protein [Cantharellus anzutake]